MKVLIFTTYRCKLSDQIFSFQRMLYLIVIEWKTRTMKDLELFSIPQFQMKLKLLGGKTQVFFFSFTNVQSLIATLETNY